MEALDVGGAQLDQGSQGLPAAFGLGGRAEGLRQEGLQVRPPPSGIRLQHLQRGGVWKAWGSGRSDVKKLYIYVNVHASIHP